MAEKKSAKRDNVIATGARKGMKGRNVPVSEGGQHVQDQRQEEVLAGNGEIEKDDADNGGDDE